MKVLAWFWRVALLLALVANGIVLPASAHELGTPAHDSHCRHHDAASESPSHHDGHHAHGAGQRSGHGCCGGVSCHCGCTLPPGVAANLTVPAAQVHFAQALPPDSRVESLIVPRALLRPPIG